MDAKVIPLEDMFNEYASAATVGEGNKRDNVPSGPYNMQVTKYEGREFEGRKYAHLTISCFNEVGQKRGTVFTDVSWQERRDAQGKLDKKTRLYAQLAKALFATSTDNEIADKSVKEVLDTSLLYKINGYVSERFKDQEGNWYNARTSDDAKAYREKGYDSMSLVTNFSKVK